MASLKQVLFTVTTLAVAWGQRPFFAGFRPIGYPELSTPSADELDNKFGELNSTVSTGVSTTTQRLPVEANGDRELVNRLSKLPIDKQPFWFINWQALEANRNNPQTYDQRPSQFVRPVQPTQQQPAPANNDMPFRGGGETNPNNGDTEVKKPNKSAHRDVDVSAFLNNDPGTFTNAGNTNAASNTYSRATESPHVDTLGNRFVDGTPKPNTGKNPQDNIVFQNQPQYPTSRPVQNHNAGQVVTSFESVPYNSHMNRGASISNSKPNPHWDPDSFESPYPILDPLTRHPEQWPMVNSNSNTKGRKNEQIFVNSNPPLEKRLRVEQEQTANGWNIRRDNPQYFY